MTIGTRAVPALAVVLGVLAAVLLGCATLARSTHPGRFCNVGTQLQVGDTIGVVAVRDRDNHVVGWITLVAQDSGLCLAPGFQRPMGPTRPGPTGQDPTGATEGLVDRTLEVRS